MKQKMSDCAKIENSCGCEKRWRWFQVQLFRPFQLARLAGPGGGCSALYQLADLQRCQLLAAVECLRQGTPEPLMRRINNVDPKVAALKRRGKKGRA